MIDTVSLTAIPGVPDVKPGDDLAQILGDCLAASGHGVQEGDVLCIAHKVFSKAEGNIVRLADVTPSDEAVKLAEELNKDPRKVHVILGQSARVVRSFKRPEQNEGVMICEHRLGFISANAAVDESNAEGDDTVITLPDDPDASARALQHAIQKRFGVRVGVVMTDTFGRPWRIGQVNVVVGLADVPATTPEQGNTDAWGRPLAVTEPAFADEISAASGLVVRKAAKTPLVLFRGLEWTPKENSSAGDILRARQEDMFR
jgi:coenzyme F420-0:L-glutamate ligase/coenzyme F420-1:gamma-L-glutamate ligase